MSSGNKVIKEPLSQNRVKTVRTLMEVASGIRTTIVNTLIGNLAMEQRNCKENSVKSSGNGIKIQRIVIGNTVKEQNIAVRPLTESMIMSTREIKNTGTILHMVDTD